MTRKRKLVLTVLFLTSAVCVLLVWMNQMGWYVKGGESLFATTMRDAIDQLVADGHIEVLTESHEPLFAFIHAGHAAVWYGGIVRLWTLTISFAASLLGAYIVWRRAGPRREKGSGSAGGRVTA